MGENELLDRLVKFLEGLGCEITVRVNEELWFFDKDGRRWVLELKFKGESDTGTKPNDG